MKFIYKITNQINNKVYIGQTFDLAQRKAQHLFEGRPEGTADRPIYRSMRKHGLENFIFEVIEECADEAINEREIFWISHFGSTSPERGYNLSKGGQGHTDESRQKLSEALKGNKHCVGRVLSEKTKQKLSEASSKQKCSIGTRSKLRAAARFRKKNGDPTLLNGSLPGESHPCAKLNWELVREMRKQFAEGKQIIELVTAFGLSRPTISRVVRNISWIEEN
jgi:group I intron endonuclease